MHPAIEVMLNRHSCRTTEEYKNALKEIMQEIALLGLFRQNFFHHATFYGGTALRIAHNLSRFSEDLDFTLDRPNKHFDLRPYLKGVEEEFKAYGLTLITEKKNKTQDTGVESAFLKANTLEYLMMIEGIKDNRHMINHNDLIKIKLEIDINPPVPSGQTETLFLLEPIPFSYKILTLPSLFGGKLHAILCREYKGGRIKGRDHYDFIWYIAKKVNPDLDYLKGKLIESGALKKKDHFTLETLKSMLVKRFESTNWEQAKKDVLPFIKNGRELDLWSKEFFLTLVKRI